MIEVTLNTTDTSEQEWQYPCLVESDNGLIIYAINGDIGNKFKGVVISGTAFHNAGHYSATWNKPTFKLYTHPITLKNI